MQPHTKRVLGMAGPVWVAFLLFELWVNLFGPLTFGAIYLPATAFIAVGGAAGVDWTARRVGFVAEIDKSIEARGEEDADTAGFWTWKAKFVVIVLFLLGLPSAFTTARSMAGLLGAILGTAVGAVLLGGAPIWIGRKLLGIVRGESPTATESTQAETADGGERNKCAECGEPVGARRGENTDGEPLCLDCAGLSAEL